MKKEKVLIACSGGPDSMALLDMSKDKYKVYVCHINYHKRKSALRDQNIVRKYCKNHNIPFYKFDYKDNKKGNFQKNARDYRYNCFKDLCHELDIKKVFTAHHQDDHIETYLMQLKRNTSVSYYGISNRVILDNVVVCRPLLNRSKKYLLSYVIKHNVPFGIDESNLSNHYERNRIRHSKIDKMKDSQKRIIVDEIKKKNIELKNEISVTSNFIRKNTKIKFNEFISFKYFNRLVRMLLYMDLSDKYISEIKKALLSKTNIDLKVRGKYICKEYGFVYVYDVPFEYVYTFNKIVFGKYDYFKITNKGESLNYVSVSKDDFPLVIRNYHNFDSIKMHYGTKKINRFFIDNKISSYDRKIWPIVLNKNNEVIFVPGIGCNINHYSSKQGLYVLKLS